MEGAAWVERRQGALSPGRDRAGCCRGTESACPSWCPWLPCRPPGCVLWMLYLISHVWNSNYVTSQQRVAMTAGPFPRVAHTLVEEEGARPYTRPPPNLNPKPP